MNTGLALIEVEILLCRGSAQKIETDSRKQLQKINHQSIINQSSINHQSIIINQKTNCSI